MFQHLSVYSAKKSAVCLTILLSVLGHPAAYSQVTVIGGGIAHDCYEAAKYKNVSPGEGEDICTRAIQLEAMTPAIRAATYTNRGVMRMRDGEYEAALSDYAIAQKMAPETGEIYLNEGAAYIFTKNYTAAFTSLDMAIELKSVDLHAAYYNRAIAREKLGDAAGAYGDFKMALELKPDWEMAAWQLTRFTVTTN